MKGPFTLWMSLTLTVHVVIIEVLENDRNLCVYNNVQTKQFQFTTKTIIGIQAVRHVSIMESKHCAGIASSSDVVILIDKPFPQRIV